MSKIWYRCPQCFDENYHDTPARCNNCGKEIEQDVSIVLTIEVKQSNLNDIKLIEKYLVILTSAVSPTGARYTGTVNSGILPTIIRKLISFKDTHHVGIQIIFL